MSKKDKKNPHRMPVSAKAVDTQAILAEATSTMVLHCWYCFMGALIDFPETTKESLLQLWNDANNYSEIASQPENENRLNADLTHLEKLVGLKRVDIPNPDNIRNAGDLKRFKKKVCEKSLYAGFSLMAQPLVKANYSVDFLRRLFEKAYGINDFIDRHEMTVDEINDALRDEFSVELYSDHGVAHIAELCEVNPTI